MNPYQSPQPVDDLLPWFSGIPIWLRRVVKISFGLCCIIVACGLLNMAMIWSSGNFYSTQDFVRKSLGVEAERVFEELVDHR